MNVATRMKYILSLGLIILIALIGAACSQRESGEQVDQVTGYITDIQDQEILLSAGPDGQPPMWFSNVPSSLEVGQKVTVIPDARAPVSLEMPSHLMAKKVNVIAQASDLPAKLTEQEAVQQAIRDVGFPYYAIDELTYSSADATWYVRVREWVNEVFNSEHDEAVKTIVVQDR
ncbi:hypothetical protein [Cohnella hashimotonis]|uniref:DUF3221 domain-containing protein n=1 Tax=Cohnella hashimotonis TaxID=2826895 RepID=A0ABT6TLX9_9BACL|nr:hypothetical protein [Cohnella hashimotonis]MDI4647871.1 hypothetical protein [Cohnella hashimotonis]